MIATGSGSGDIQIWDSKSHNLIGEPFRGHLAAVVSLCFWPDSRWLVSGSWYQSVHVWNCQTGQAEDSTLWRHTDGVLSVCTDGRLIVSGSLDTTICIWDLHTGEGIDDPINTGHSVYAVVLSNNGRILAGVGCKWNVPYFLDGRSYIRSELGRSFA